MATRVYQPFTRAFPFLSQCLHSRATTTTSLRQRISTRLFSATSISMKKKRVLVNGKLIRGVPEPKRTLPYQLKPWIEATALPPPYPYTPSQRLYKQGDTGLYGGMRVQRGNKVSKRNEIKTRRTWKPNIVRKNLYSKALGRFLKLKVATRVLRTVDKVGGLDEYLLGTKAARIKELGEEGWRFRWVILQALKDTERVRNDPRLMFELDHGIPKEGGEEAEAVQSTTVEIPAPEANEEEEEDDSMDDEELEGRIRQRLEENRHMREEPAPRGTMEAITAPIRNVVQNLGRR